MVDIHFIDFYIGKKYSKSLAEYFGVSRPVVSIWRKRGMPQPRIDEFLRREKSVDIFKLFEDLYKRES